MDESLSDISCPQEEDPSCHGSNKKVMRLEGQISDGEKVDKNGTMTIGSKMGADGFVQIPPEMLVMILANLEKLSDLLTCRRVNSTWSIHMSKILQQRNIFQICFDGSSKPSLTSHRFSKLIRLNRCLQTSKKLFGGSLAHFPCTNFKFSHLYLSDEILQFFLNLYGPFIKYLTLFEFETKIEDDGQLKSLNRLLTQQAPNIKYLSLSHLKVKPEPKEVLKGGSPFSLFNKNNNEEEPVKLSQLEIIDEGVLDSVPEKNIMEEILGAALNLKVYKIPGPLGDLYPIHLLMSKGKLDTLKCVELSICQDNIRLCEKFASVKPKLESFTFKVDYQRSREDQKFLTNAADIINKILQSSKDTLTTFDPFYPLDHVTGLIFPVLNKMKRINIKNGHNHLFKSIFPPGLNLSKVFPKVKQLNLNGLHLTLSISWDTPFPFNVDQNQWTSVLTLVINHHFCNRDFDNLLLCRLCPNVKNLIVDGHKVEFGTVCDAIFYNMKGLESLEFFNVDCTLPRNPSWHSALNGFSRFTCHKGIKFEGMDVRHLREKLSILEISGLKNLKITIDRVSDPLISSCVSNTCEFQWTPNLKVTVTRDHRDGQHQTVNIF